MSRSFLVPGRSRLNDTIGERAIYVASGQIRELSFADGSDRLIASGSQAKAELSTLSFASGRRVFVRPLP